MYATRLALAFTVALILTLVAAGCTDDSGDGAGSTTTATTESAGPPVQLELEGPITGGERNLPYNAMPAGFEEDYGYTEEEYFVSGTATAFTSSVPLTPDGAWELTPGSTADYTTRILVRQPADPADFNGIVIVEWNNVTAGRDSDPGFGMLYPEILGSGYGYMGVSAQEVSIEGGGGILEVPGVPPEALLPLKQWDPERYAPLDHPGDDYSYDLFTQMGALAQGRAATSPFDGLDVDTVIAIGESQSAMRLVSYVDGVHPLAATYDGFLIQNRGSSGTPFGEGPNDTPPDPTLLRTDLQAPTLVFVTETDLTLLNFLAARQPDTDHIAAWEVAGTAHADQSTLDYGVASGSRWSDSTVDFSELCGLANSGPQAEVARASLARLRAWVQDGTAPPPSPRIETDDSGELVRDADGIVVGGIRTPDVDAPVSTLTGDGNDASIFCMLFGQEIPFSADRLAALYPSHDVYIEQVTASADDAVEAGFLLGYDRDAIVDRAAQSDIGG
jgi:hypothetical protein